MHDIEICFRMWIDEWRQFPQVFLFTCSALLFYTIPLVIAMLCYFIKTKIIRSEAERHKYFITQNRIFNLIIIFLFIVGLMNAPFHFFNYGNTTIGSVFEKKHYVEDYYVYITSNRQELKRYKVCATIEKTSPSITEECYFIKKVYWANGGYLTFSGEGKIGVEVYPNQETEVTDYHDDTYYITLTTEKVHK